MRRDYYEYIEEEIEAWKQSGKPISPTIQLVPDFIKLLTDMLDKDEVDRQGRFWINTALGYFVAPDDVLPDDVYGPEGYMDDVFVCTLVLKKLYEYYPDLMLTLWSNDQALAVAIKAAYDESSMYMNAHNLTTRILEYSGLQD
jgi:uncharacterized membrane protein YkvA (DUF1232 family)